MPGTARRTTASSEAESFDASQGALRQGTNVGGWGVVTGIGFRNMNFDVSLPKLLQVTSSGGAGGSGSISFRLDSPQARCLRG